MVEKRVIENYNWEDNVKKDGRNIYKDGKEQMNYAIAIIVIIISAYLFKKSVRYFKKINLINVTGYVFYSLMIFLNS